MVTKHDKIFVQKLRQLLNSSTFDDIAFNCKDGKLSGNRLILSLYSSFLRKIFEDNPNIVSHPLNDDPTTGINITEIEVKDLGNLLRILNTQTSADVSEDCVEGIVGAARLMEIELKVDKLRSGLVRIRAIPDLNENRTKKKINVGDKAINIVVTRKDESETISEDAKKPKTKKRAQNSGIKQQPKIRNKMKALSPTSTGVNNEYEFSNNLYLAVCPYCNITCKSVRGLQVHVGYIHKNEIKHLKNETGETVAADGSNPETSTEKNEKGDVIVSVTTVANDDLPKSSNEQNSITNNAADKPILGPSLGSGDHMDYQTNHQLIDSVSPNNTESINQIAPFSMANLVMNPQLSNPGLIDSLPHHQSYSEPPVVSDLPADFPLFPRQQGQGTLICLPKTQLYEHIENGYSCGICEMKFPNLANLNVHMTYCHGLTILVKEN